MIKATHKQKLALYNIWDRYRFDPEARREIGEASHPAINFIREVLEEKPFAPEILVDLERIRTLEACTHDMEGGS